MDNGYLEWLTTVLPLKDSAYYMHIHWTKLVGESIQKDVECALGIMKGRWTILKTGI